MATGYPTGMEAIRQYFNQFLVLQDAEWQAFAACLQKRSLAKKDKLLVLGQACHEICFIKSGSFRFYHECAENTSLQRYAPY